MSKGYSRGKRDRRARQIEAQKRRWRELEALEERFHLAVVSWSGTISSNTTWQASDIHQVAGDLTVAAGVTLTIQPGAVVKFDDSRMMTVLGTVLADGTQAQPIVFTSMTDDTGLDGALGTADDADTNGNGPSNGTKGRWDSIQFSDGSMAMLDFVEVRFGGISTEGSVVVTGQQTTFTMTNSTIRDSLRYGLLISNSDPTLTNVAFRNNSNDTLRGAARMDPSSRPVISGAIVSNNGINAMNVDGGTLLASTTWNAPGMDFRLASDVTVPAGMTLTLVPGQVVKQYAFNDAGLIINGTLTANGTALAPIIITSERDDSVGADLYNNGADIGFGGDGGGIRFNAGSHGTLSHVEVRYAGDSFNSASGSASIFIASDDVTITDSIVRDSGYRGVRIQNADPTLTNVSFDRNFIAAISMDHRSNPTITNPTFAQNGINGIALDGFFTLTENATWNTPGVVYRMQGPVTVPTGLTLTIGAGQIIKTTNDYSLIVEGTLVTQGTENSPVIFTSDGDDAAGGDTTNNGAPGTLFGGEIGGIRFSPGSHGTVDYTEVRYAGDAFNSPNGSASIYINEADDVTITGGAIRDSGYDGIRIVNADPTITGMAFERSVRAAISMDLRSQPTITDVTMTQNAINAVALDGFASLTENATWNSPGVVYRLQGPVTVPAGFTLTIAAGQIIKSTNDYGVIVEGTLITQGTNTTPVIFTSDGDDSVGGDTTNNGAPGTLFGGEIGGIRFSPGSHGTLDYVEVRYAGDAFNSPNGSASIFINGTDDVTITGGLVRDSGYDGLRVQNADPVIAGMTFERNFRSAISMDLLSDPTITGPTLTANGVNGVAIDSFVAMTEDVVWDDPDIVYRLSGPFTIPAGLKLTIAPGQIIKFANGVSSEIYVDGTLIADGTTDQPIIFTSLRDDTAGGDTNANGDSTGQIFDWHAIRFRATSTNNLLDHVEIRFAGANVPGAVTVIGAPLTMTNSLVTQSFTHAVAAQSNASVTLENNLLLSNGSAGISSESGSTVRAFNNTINGNQRGVLANAATVILTNNLITGSTTAGVASSGGATVTMSFNDVFNTGNVTKYSGLADQTGLNGNLSVNPQYDSESEDFPFALKQGSPVVDAGTLTGAPAADRLGTLRIDDPSVPNTGGANGYADLGAFELDRWVATIDAPRFSGQIVVGDTLRVMGTGEVLPPPVRFSWELGDGLTSTREDPGLISYQTVGSKSLRMTIAGQDGATDPSPPSRTITVVADTGSLPDFDVEAFEIPDGLSLESASTFTYRVRNIGQGAAGGSWIDALYLSRDPYLDASDTRLATRAMSQSLAVSAAYDGEFTTTVTEQQLGAGVNYLIVSVDDNWQILERHQLNNEEAIETDAAVPELVSGQATSGTFDGSGAGRYYRFDVVTSGNLRFKLDDANNQGTNELYIRRGLLPTRGVFDARQTQSGADVEAIVSGAAPGTWYVLAYGALVSDSGQYSISASAASVVLQSVTPDHHGNSVPAVLTLAGAGFTTGTTVELVAGNGAVIAASQVIVDSFSQLTATFAPGTAAGVYDVRVKNGASTSVLDDAFTFIAGGQANLETNIVVPGALGYHQLGTIIVEYSNTGSVAMPAPLLILTPTQTHADQTTDARALLTLEQTGLIEGFWTSAVPEGFSYSVQILASGATPGVLQPGESFSVPVYWAGWQQPWDFNYPAFDFNLLALTESDVTPLDWNNFKQTVPALDGDPAAWNAILANVQTQVGNTWGGFVAALNKNASYLGKLGVRVSDLGQLFAFETHQANGMSLAAELAASSDAFVSAPGLDLSFSRGFANTISGRYEIGALGRGWSWNDVWQSSLSVEQDGTVVISGAAESRRVFQPDSRGGYFSRTGDTGKLTAGAGGTFTLRELDGKITVFRADHHIDYVQDLNGNRITAGYANGLLTSLAHNRSELAMQFAYNAAGRITQITDAVGRTTQFAYDAGNEHLLSATDFAGRVTSYTYSSGAGAALEHALLSVTNPDGTQVIYTYDSRGRLASTARAGNAEKVQYSYGLGGTITATDAAGAALTTYFDHRGLILKVSDPLQRDTFFTYDANFNLTRVTDPSGLTSSYEYDARGNVTRTTDPAGNVVQFTHGQFATLRSMTDPTGDTTQHSYDSNGNLIFTTYADGSMDQYAFDPAGNILSTTNRRGQNAEYQYDSKSRLIARGDESGPFATYAYDAHGNLTSATDFNGTTSFTYDSADRVVQIDYPGGSFLKYQYDSAGRRVKMFDHTGFTVNYTYDTAGRLASLTDGAGNPIVAYTYNSAGQLTREDNGNGTFTTYQYDLTGKLLHLINSAPGNVVNSRFDYTYDSLGRAATMTTLDGQWQYTYDAAGELVRAVFTSNNTGVVPHQDLQYTYDAAGNRTSTLVNGTTTQYTTNAMDQYTSVGGVAHTYDADGNLTAAGSTTYSYNIDNQLIGVTAPGETWSYLYDALGNRVASTHNGQTSKYLIDPFGLGDVVGEFDGSGSTIAHYTHGIGVVSTVNAAGSAAYYDFDAGGNTAALTGASGAVLNRYRYLPFGQTLTSSESRANPFQFAGEYGVMRENSALSYMRARFMDVAEGRFTQADPIGMAGGLNMYRYAGNNPVSFVDPSGLVPGWFASAYGTEAARDIGFFATERGAALMAEIRRVSQVVGAGARNPLVQKFLKNQTREGAFRLLLELRKIANPGFAAWDKFYGASRGAAAGAGGAIRGFSTGFVGQSVLLSPARLTLGTVAAAVTVAQVSYWAGGKINDHLLSNSFKDAIGNTLLFFFDNSTYRAGQGWRTANASSRDPNEKLGPAGFGTGHFLNPVGVFPYRINFENDAEATAPAQVVAISDPLTNKLDWSTFELTELGFGDIVIAVPPSTTYFETVIETTASNGNEIEVHFQGGIDLVTGQISAFFSTLDPLTGLPPDVLTGFIAPEDGTGRGQGFIGFTIKPIGGLVSGTQIRNVASITFDFGETIDTNQIDPHDPSQGTDPQKEALVTIDTAAPTSAVTALPASSEQQFTVSWAGADAGSGVAFFDVFVSDNNGAYSLLLDDTTLTSTLFSGVAGHTYRFYSVAADNVGNREADPAQADATTLIDPPVTNTINPGGKFTFTDSNGTVVTVALAAKTGTATVFRKAANNAPGEMLAIEFAGLDAKASLSITGKGGSDAGVTTLGRLSGNSPLAVLNAKTVDLTGEGIILTGAGFIASAQLRDVIGGADVIMPGTGGTAGVSLTIAKIESGTQVSSGSPIKAMTVADWAGGGSLTAPTVGTLKIAGDKKRSLIGNFAADITLTSADAKGISLGSLTAASVPQSTIQAAGGITSIKVLEWLSGGVTAGFVSDLATLGDKKRALAGDFKGQVTLTNSSAPLTLGKLTIAGTLADARITSAGNVGAVTLGAIDDSQILVGVANGVTSLASNVSQFVLKPDKPNLASLTIKGLVANQQSFHGSVIDAWNIGKVSLKLVDTAAQATPFGFAANVIGALSFQANGVNGGKAVALKSLDTTADLADVKKNPSQTPFPVGGFEVRLL